MKLNGFGQMLISMGCLNAISNCLMLVIHSICLEPRAADSISNLNGNVCLLNFPIHWVCVILPMLSFLISEASAGGIVVVNTRLR